jgi:type III secretory pathway lipoprotein EscJ
MTTIQRIQLLTRSYLDKGKRLNYSFLLIAFFLLLTGCRTEILSDLSEQEVGKILYELRIRGIDASSTENGKKLHKIEVSAEQSSEASQIASLIRPLLRDRSQEDKPPGFLSGPEQEKLYVTQQLAHQLEDSLKILPSIVAARVTIAFPPNQGVNEQEKKADNLGSASVLVISSTGANISRDSIAQFIANGTAIAQERVHVIISELPKTADTFLSTYNQNIINGPRLSPDPVAKTEQFSLEQPSTTSPPISASPHNLEEKIEGSSPEFVAPSSTPFSWITRNHERIVLIAIPISGTAIALFIGTFLVRRRRSRSLKAAYRKL